jgi:hypothetical protein
MCSVSLILLIVLVVILVIVLIMVSVILGFQTNGVPQPTFPKTAGLGANFNGVSPWGPWHPDTTNLEAAIDSGDQQKIKKEVGIACPYTSVCNVTDAMGKSLTGGQIPVNSKAIHTATTSGGAQYSIVKYQCPPGDPNCKWW